MLAAEACGTLLPYVSEAMRDSLVLSMLQQLVAVREGAVRGAAARALALLVARCTDPDRYSQCEQLMAALATDGCPEVHVALKDSLVPALGRWALQIGQYTIC